MFLRSLRRGLIALAVLIAGGAVLFTAAVWWPEPTLTPVRTTTPMAFVDVAIVDVEAGRLVPAQTVVVDAGRITAVGSASSVPVPASAMVIDGRGRYLLPALWDMHTHVYAFAPLLDLPLSIAYGVTNIRDMQGCPRS